MYDVIKEIFSLLNKEQKKQFYKLQILVVLMSLGELIGIASIAPFMALVGNINILNGDNIIAKIFLYFHFIDPYNFVFIVGIFVLLMLGLSSALSIYTTWKLIKYSKTVGSEISHRLYSYYMKRDLLFHLNSSSASLTKQITIESDRVSENIITPLMLMNAKIILASLLSISIFLYNPFVALVGVTMFLISYLIIYKLVRKELYSNGKELSFTVNKRFQLMNEGFGGIRDIILLGREKNYIDKFQITTNSYSYVKGKNNILSQIPKYFIEFLAFGSMIGLVLYLLSTNKNSLELILPILSVYALAGFKLLPALQQIYVSISNIKGNIASFESIRDDLVMESQMKDSLKDIDIHTKKYLNNELLLENISFHYPLKETLVLDNLNMSIKANTTIGIVGYSGSGKSTTIDIIMGLIEPQKGDVKIDGEVITKTALREWQNNIGFVAQSIFLSEGTIAENVAFGIDNNSIDRIKVMESLKMAHLEELIQDMPLGLDTKVGERGVQLSGGQRQRIGIARALYGDKQILIFDEATSALDGITEKIIMDAIDDYSGQKTIIMIAHRLKTIRKCDLIYFMENGKIVDSGKYEELLKKNENFKKMDKHA